MEDFIRALPKAELHIHIEGSLEPEMMFELASRNGLEMPFASVDDVRRAYEFADLQSFLDIYYRAANVLQTEQDFYDLMRAYLERANADNVRHAEIFFDPQTHTHRGIPFATFMEGFHRACADAEKQLGISSMLIMCFLRHLTEKEAFETLDQALPFKEWIVGIGLDSSEVGHPPEKFAGVFERARSEGFRAVAHAGEEGPPAYVAGALDALQVERIDHGIRSEDDPNLLRRLVEEQIPLTMCPLSNVELRVYDRLEDHNLKRLLDAGVRVTVNSDDPSYFGGYVVDNLIAIQRALGLDRGDLVTLARNSFEASFLHDARKAELLAEMDQMVG